MTTCPSTETACEKWARLLDEANGALHSLYLGGRVASISSGDGKQVTYSQAKIYDLRGYIAMLQMEVDRCNGVGRCNGRGRAVQFIPIG